MIIFQRSDRGCELRIGTNDMSEADTLAQLRLLIPPTISWAFTQTRYANGQYDTQLTLHWVE